MIKGAIFDMDGLLIDTESISMASWEQVSREAGFDAKQEDFYEIRSLSNENAKQVLLGVFGEDYPYDELKAARTELLLRAIRKNGAAIKPGVTALLDFLDSRGIPAAVATATRQERTTEFLKSAGLINRFAKIVTGNMVQHNKPEPDLYLKAAEILELPTEECAAFEDSPNGVISASRAGCHVIMVPDLTPPDEKILPLVTAVVPTLDLAIPELEKLI